MKVVTHPLAFAACRTRPPPVPELRPPARSRCDRVLGLHRAHADRPLGGAPAAGLIAGRYLPQRLLGRGGAKDV